MYLYSLYSLTPLPYILPLRMSLFYGLKFFYSTDRTLWTALFHVNVDVNVRSATSGDALLAKNYSVSVRCNYQLGRLIRVSPPFLLKIIQKHYRRAHPFRMSRRILSFARNRSRWLRRPLSQLGQSCEHHGSRLFAIF